MKFNTISIIILLLSLSSHAKFMMAGTSLQDSTAYDIVVAADGSGDYTKVQDAINAAPNNSANRTVVFIKPGTYKEKLVVLSVKKKLTLLGESFETTILTYDDHAGITSDYASTKIMAEDFFAENITFQNTIDSRVSGGQAAALWVEADRAMFHKCKITGFQDTYYLKTNTRSYMKDCIIDGTTDFIYGSGIALFENCIIRNRKDSHITASSQAVGKNKFGFVFKNCVILKYPGESVSNASLGRPWGAGARAVYLNCNIGKHIRPQGFAPWSTDPNHKYYDNINTAYYAVYNCTGAGYKPASLLSVVHILNDTLAAEYTKENIFAANSTTATTLVGDWNPIIENDTCPSILPPANAGQISGETEIPGGTTELLYTVPKIEYADSYVWTLTGGVTGESTSDTILISFDVDFSSGTLTVKGRNSNGDGVSTTLTLSAPTGINDQEESKMMIYPNPVKGVLNIDTEFGFNKLSFYDITGSLVFERSFQENISTTSVQLKQLKGAYLLEISNSKTISYSKIIVE